MDLTGEHYGAGIFYKFKVDLNLGLQTLQLCENEALSCANVF